MKAAGAIAFALLMILTASACAAQQATATAPATAAPAEGAQVSAPAAPPSVAGPEAPAPAGEAAAWSAPPPPQRALLELPGIRPSRTLGLSLSGGGLAAGLALSIYNLSEFYRNAEGGAMRASEQDRLFGLTAGALALALSGICFDFYLGGGAKP